MLGYAGARSERGENQRGCGRGRGVEEEEWEEGQHRGVGWQGAAGPGAALGGGVREEVRGTDYTTPAAQHVTRQDKTRQDNTI